MAKVKGFNPPENEFAYDDADGISHYFGEFFRMVFREGSVSPRDPGTDFIGKSRRGERPTQQGPGTPAQIRFREAFKNCASLWNTLPEECPDPLPDPPVTSKESVWGAKTEHGVTCTYYDLFMKCCIKWALDHGGAMPDGDCFPCVSGCTCAGVSIGFTTQGMEINESQNLWVLGGSDSCVYNWSILSGDGSLSANTGLSVGYTAPSSNPNCDGNAIIKLSVEGSVCDTLAIAINAVSGNAIAVTRCRDRACPPCSWISGKCGACWSHYRCNSSYRSDLENIQCACLGGEYGTVSAYVKTCLDGIYNAGYNDRRTPAMIIAGCCPEQLL